MLPLDKKIVKATTWIGLLGVLCYGYGFGQTIDEAIDELAVESANAYAKPAVNAFAANLNSGWFTCAPNPVKKGFNLEFGIISMGATLDKSEKHFSSSSVFRITSEQAATYIEKYVDDQDFANAMVDVLLEQDLMLTLEGPTVVGSHAEDIIVRITPVDPEPVRVDHPDYPFAIYVDLPEEEQELDMGGLLNSFPLLPTATPQLKIGTLYGTQAIFRYVPKIHLNDDFGDLKFQGLGLQHNLSVWFQNRPPVDVTLGFMKQSMSVGDKVKFNSLAYGLNVSRIFGGDRWNIAPFTGLLFESAEIKVHYSETIETEIGDQEITLDAEMKAANKSRFSLGFHAHLMFADLMFDYSISANNVMVAGLIFRM